MKFETIDSNLLNITLAFYGSFLFFMTIFGNYFKVNNLYHIAFTLFCIGLFFRKKIRQFSFEDKEINEGLIICSLFLAWFSFSNLWGGNVLDMLSALKHSAYILAFILIFNISKKYGYKNKIVFLIFLGLTILCFFSFFFADEQFLLQNRLDNSFPYAPQNAIDLGGYFAIGILLGLMLIKETNCKWLFFPVLFLLAGLLLTQSRGPLFSLIISCVPLLFLIKKMRISYLLIGLSIILAICLTLSLTHYGQFLVNRISMSYIQSFTRIGIWEDALTLIKQKPIFGWGFNKELDFVNNIGQHVHTTHSMYFATLLKGGVIGFTLLFILLCYAIKMGWKQIKQGCEIEASIMIFSMLFYTTQGMFIIGNPGVSWLMFWLPLAVVMSQPRKN